MEKIIAPLQSRDEGVEIKNLHEALLAVVDKIKSSDIDSYFQERIFKDTFESERNKSAYGQATRQLISAFQKFYMAITPNGMVDEATADALNKLLVDQKLIEAP